MRVNTKDMNSTCLFLCDIFQAQINSLVCWSCTRTPGHVPFQIVSTVRASKYNARKLLAQSVQVNTMYVNSACLCLCDVFQAQINCLVCWSCTRSGAMFCFRLLTQSMEVNTMYVNSACLCLCDVVQAQINSQGCCFCTSTLGLILFQIVSTVHV